MDKKENMEAERDLLLARLTVSERRCLELVAKGHVSKEIARVLDVSPHTVDGHLRAATRKLGARNRFVAAQIFINKQNSSYVTPPSNLIAQDWDIPPPSDAGEKTASAGEGNGLDDLNQVRQRDPESSDSDADRPWLEPSHPIAKFFGGENRLPASRRILSIGAIALGFAIAFGVLLNGLVGLSRVLSIP